MGDPGSLPVIGHNPITVWADDLADPAPNSGPGVAGQLPSALDVLYDLTRQRRFPTTALPFADERDERRGRCERQG